jgi:TP901 family phage tail tape measure protein
MARFAEQANKSAQALSTSTLAYTDAALIYYQQGLDADAVAARTETTLKMSNVTGESAEEVSSYMTAIWNNFYDGSQSLESFADKITALGAATASSSREIAGGLQQFAAIANTVGLSYDYAATALATIVARTRQSESTVGNGLRTIFARLSSLKQGGTEDGVDLTKYTKALQQVGINVLDQNGQLKEMDSILDDIGEK